MFSHQILHKSGELKHRAEVLKKKLASCNLCPRKCGADRRNAKNGFCRTGAEAVVFAATPHYGEEPALSGSRGSGTIFFAGCNLKCVYCQNWQISQPEKIDQKNEITSGELASKMISLQKMGCHNINFVSPSHFVAQIVEAVDIAAGMGLSIPLAYNTNAYDDFRTLKYLDGVIDIYLPDLKYGNDSNAVKYSQARNYRLTSRRAVREMFRQTGNLKLDEHGLARRGLIVRHLVLPNGLAGTEEVFRFLVEEISPKVAVSIMAQYYPAHRSEKIPLLSRKISAAEYDNALSLLDEYGLENGWIQGHDSPEIYRPDFEMPDPFCF